MGQRFLQKLTIYTKHSLGEKNILHSSTCRCAIQFVIAFLPLRHREAEGCGDPYQWIATLRSQ
jgi:hypothetical protein